MLWVTHGDRSLSTNIFRTRALHIVLCNDKQINKSNKMFLGLWERHQIESCVGIFLVSENGLRYLYLVFADQDNKVLRCAAASYTTKNCPGRNTHHGPTEKHSASCCTALRITTEEHNTNTVIIFWRQFLNTEVIPETPFQKSNNQMKH